MVLMFIWSIRIISYEEVVSFMKAKFIDEIVDRLLKLNKIKVMFLINKK